MPRRSILSAAERESCCGTRSVWNGQHTGYGAMTMPSMISPVKPAPVAVADLVNGGDDQARKSPCIFINHNVSLHRNVTPHNTVTKRKTTRARAATISQEQVNAAADAIRASGAKPTARAVREAVGGGSMATVLKLLQVWHGGQVRVEDGPIVLPAGLQRALVDFIAQEVAGAKAGLQSDLVVAQQANGDLIAESERQSSTIELQAVALESALAEKAELIGRLAQVESELARSTEDVAGERQAAELARTENAKAQLRLDALPRIEAEVDRLRAELASERTAKVAAEQAAAVAHQKAAGLAERLADAQAQLKEQKQHVNTLENDKRRLETDVAAIGKEARDSAAAVGKLQGLTTALQQQLNNLQPPATEQSTKTGDKPVEKTKKTPPNNGMPG